MKYILLTIVVISIFFTAGLLHPKLAVAQPDDGKYEEWHIFQDNIDNLVKYIVELERGREEAEYAVELADRESDFNPTAQNPHSTAYGVFQFLDATWEGEKTDNPRIQTEEAIRYVEGRYGTFEEAIVFHNRNNHY